MRLTSTLPRAAVVLVSGAGACRLEAPGPARDSSPVRTDSVVYHLTERGGGYHAVAVATYVNRTGAPVYYARCGAGPAGGLTYGRRRTGPDSTRELFSDEVQLCGGGEPAGVLAAGDSLRVPVRLGALPQPHMQPPLRPEHLTGQQRVVFHLCAAPAGSSDACVLAPMAQRQSNPFDVRL